MVRETPGPQISGSQAHKSTKAEGQGPTWATVEGRMAHLPQTLLSKTTLFSGFPSKQSLGVGWQTHKCPGGHVINSPVEHLLANSVEGKSVTND